MNIPSEKEAQEAVKTLLRWAGDDPDREGLLDTPARVARMYREIFQGLRTDAPKVTTFSGCDEMVVVKGIKFTSMCEHHLVPFIGQVHIGYLPSKRIAGLSKFGRIVDWVASRPQIQESMTSQIADHLMEALTPTALIVVVEAEHMCMSLRGIKKPDHSTVTSAIRPEPDSMPQTEFWRLLELGR
jgi:GTP cyclohydrolase I